MERSSPIAADGLVDSPAAWRRLALSLALGVIACVGSWSVVVVLPVAQADLGTVRAGASLAYSMMMVGFAAGSIWLGGLVDRSGIARPILIGAAVQGAGYVISGLSPALSSFALAHALIGFGASIGFSPLLADISHWFRRWRAFAVGVAATGNYLAGTLWSPLLQHLISTHGWRATHVGLGIALFLAMAGMSLAFRTRLPRESQAAAAEMSARARGALGISPTTLMVVLSVAGFACCMAMAMPQVHIVAYCGDLGYGVARGAEMLALMLGLGIISRVASGYLADRFGGLMVLLVGSAMQAVALFLYLLFDGLTSLYIVSGIFGLFQGGIVPMYAVITRQFLPPEVAGARIGIVMTATMAGMALGGVASGAIFDLMASYQLAFLHGLIWNLVNIVLVLWLIVATRARRPALAAA